MGYTQSAFSSIEYWMADINVCEIPAGPIPSISNIYALDNKYHFNKINFHFEFYGPSHFIYFHRWKWTEQQSFLRDDRTFEFVAESTLNASSWLNPIKIHAHKHIHLAACAHIHIIITSVCASDAATGDFQIDPVPQCSLGLYTHLHHL